MLDPRDEAWKGEPPAPQPVPTDAPVDAGANVRTPYAIRHTTISSDGRAYMSTWLCPDDTITTIPRKKYTEDLLRELGCSLTEKHEGTIPDPLPALHLTPPSLAPAP